MPDLNLWRPQIWTPMADRIRRRRRRLFHPLKFAAGDVMLDENGDVILDEDGNVLLDNGAGNDCCCGESYCAGCGQPGYLDVTFADVILCPDCYGSTNDGFPDSVKVTAASLSGTWRCSNPSLPGTGCAWNLLAGNANSYGEGHATRNDCGGANNNLYLAVSVFLTGSIWTVWARFFDNGVASDGDGGTAAWPYIFKATWTGSCWPKSSLANDFADCRAGRASGINLVCGKSGTVDISAV